MRKGVIILFAASVVLFSCKSKQDMLTGSWHAVKLENPDMDSFFVRSQHYIDTIGKNNADAMNMDIYGTTNMDSLRKVLQAQYDTAKAMQTGAIVNTVFHFNKDGRAVLIFNGISDTAKWRLEGESRLVLDSRGHENGEVVNMEILKISDMVLKLRFREDSSFSTVTFRREGK